MGQHRNKIIGAETMAELASLLKSASNASDVKRLQCVYFRGKGMNAEEVAEMVQYDVGYVKTVWTQYFKGGATALLTKPRGGRRRENMSKEEEVVLLATHTESAKVGKLLKIAPLHLILICNHPMDDYVTRHQARRAVALAILHHVDCKMV